LDLGDLNGFHLSGLKYCTKNTKNRGKVVEHYAFAVHCIKKQIFQHKS
jgi:hypothetical protein